MSLGSGGLGGLMTGGLSGGLGGAALGPYGGMIAGALGGGGGGSSSPAAVPQGWFPQGQVSQPGQWGGWPVPQPAAQPSYNFTGDMSQPGAAEGYYDQHKGQFGQPTATQGYWNQNAPRFGAPGQGDQYWNQVAGSQNTHPKSSNDAEQAYQQFQGSQPANMDPYYQHAMGTADAQLDREFANRGMAGSTQATNALQDTNNALMAQKAKDEANYGLQRGQTAGQLASGADLSSRGASQDQLGWTTGLGHLALGTQAQDLQGLLAGLHGAGQADQTGLASLLGGMGAAGQAQDALQGRGRDYFNQLMGLGGAQAGSMGDIYKTMLGADQGMFDNAIQASLGYPREGLNQSINGRASSEQGIGNLMGLLGGGKGGGGLGGMLGGFL